MLPQKLLLIAEGCFQVAEPMMEVSRAASDGSDLVRGPGFFDPELTPQGAREADLLIAFTGRSISPAS